MEVDAPPPDASSTAGAQTPTSLAALSIHAFLDFLEAECAMLVTMVMRDSPYWLKAKSCLMQSMRSMVDSALTGKNAGQIRQILYQEILNGKVTNFNKLFYFIFSNNPCVFSIRAAACATATVFLRAPLARRFTWTLPLTTTTARPAATWTRSSDTAADAAAPVAPAPF